MPLNRGARLGTGLGRVLLLIFLVGGVSPVADLAAQSGQSEIAPAPRYQAGAFRSWLFGDSYRDLWTVPIQVEYLDLRNAGGGLTPLRRGGGRQTLSLRFTGADGREYAFRSVDKAPALALHPDLEGALLGDLIQDQVSAQWPGAPILAAPLSSAAGLLHSQSRLVRMPNDPLLGEFREEFAGMLGTFEEHPDEGEDDSAGFAGLTRIAGTETVLEHLEDDSSQRIDSRTYLAARLTDLWLGDWDRHADQWRWARHESGDGFLWVPMPRDRDYAFSDYDGFLMKLVRMAVPNAVRFTDDYEVPGLLLSGRDLDRQLLSDLERPAWDSIALALQSRLTDSAIDAALERMPPEFADLRGDELAARLRIRRDRLPAAADEFYSRLAKAPEIRTTDEDETAEIQRYPDGAVEVIVRTRGGQEGDEPYYRRRFSPDETDEIRVFLHGGDDRAVVRGRAERGILVRVIGGGGADVLVDSSFVARLGKWTSLHDSGAESRIAGGAGTIVDRDAYEAPDTEPRGLIRITPADAGSNFGFRPVVDYSTTRGLVVGGGAVVTRYGFRRHPYASRTSLDLYYGPRWDGFALRATGDFRTSNPSLSSGFSLLGSQIEALRFYGFGNETRADRPADHYLVNRDLASARAELRYAVRSDLLLSGALEGQYSNPTVEAGTPLAAVDVPGADRYAAAGFRGSVDLTREAGGPFTDLHFGLTAGAFPAFWTSGGSYGDLNGAAGTTLPITPGARLSLNAGGRHVWGEYPFFAAAFLGGRGTLRGYPEWRFAGETMIHGSTEAAVRLGRLPFVMNWSVEGIVVTDAGRVFIPAESSTVWHATPGVGIALTALGYTVSAVYAKGAEGRVYLEAGAPF